MHFILFFSSFFPFTSTSVRAIVTFLQFTPSFNQNIKQIDCFFLSFWLNLKHKVNDFCYFNWIFYELNTRLSVMYQTELEWFLLLIFDFAHFFCLCGYNLNQQISVIQFYRHKIRNSFDRYFHRKVNEWLKKLLNQKFWYVGLYWVKYAISIYFTPQFRCK